MPTCNRSIALAAILFIAAFSAKGDGISGSVTPQIGGGIGGFDGGVSSPVGPVSCHQYGGYCIGDAGMVGTIYAGHTLSWADDFSGSLNIVGPNTPNGRYFSTKGYSLGPRGGFTVLGTQYDSDPLSTGYFDSNHGLAVGSQTLSQSNGLTLQARNATAGEQANMNATSPAINSGVRPQASSMIHSEGTIGFYPSASGSDIVEANIQYVGFGTSGWHPDFWVNSSNPMNTFGAGNFDSINACEGNSTVCSSSVLRIVNGSTTNVSGAGTNFSDLYSAAHITSMQLGANVVVYIDGVAKNTFAVAANAASKPMYFLITSHVYDASWFGESFSQAGWDAHPNGAHIIVNWVRVWRPSAASHFVPPATISGLDANNNLSVSYNGSGSFVVPSALTFWGDAGVTEYQQCVGSEADEPGMGLNTEYDQFPTGVTYTGGTRTIAVNFSGMTGNSGVLHCVIKAWKTDGSTFQPFRFTITRGPHLNATGVNIATGVPASIDLYPLCDVGIATPKTMSVTGLPSGMSAVFVPASPPSTQGSFIASGTPASGATASLTCTNNIGQTITSNLIFGPLQNETYALEGRVVTPLTTTTEGAADGAIAALKADGLWANLAEFTFLGMGTQQASLLNWKGDYYNPILIQTPTFSAYNGFTTNGTSNGIDTTFNPAFFSTLNAIAFSVLSNTIGQTANGGLGSFDGTNGYGLTLSLRNTSDLFSYRANDNTAATIANTDGTGLFTGMRSGATTKKAFRNGAQIGTTLSTASINLASYDFGIGVTIAPAGNTFAARQWEAYAVRLGSFADADEANLNSIISTLKTNIHSGLTLGAINTAGSWIDVGSHSALQWDSTQAWTAAAYVSLAAAPSVANPAAIIFSTTQAGHNLTGGGATPVYSGYEWWIDSNCHLRVRLISAFTTNNYLGAIGSMSFCDGHLHKVAASYDGSSTVAGVNMYVDGASDTGITSEGTTLSGTIVNAEPFYIGNQRDWPYSLGGTIQHFSLSNTVRNQAWVQSYTTAAASVDANTVLAYDFTENTGKTTADASANAFTASVCNATWQSGAVGNAPCLPQGAVSVDQGAASLSSVSASLPANVASGSAIAGSVYCACTTGLTVTDDKSNSYTVLGPDTTLAGVRYWQFYSTNLTNGPHTVTATLSSGTGTFWRMQTNEVANVISTVDGNALAYTAAATGADGLSSGSITTTINNDFIFGDGTVYTAASLSAGTNFSIGNTIFGALDNLWSEYFWQPTAGAVAATFTPSTTTHGHAGGIAFRTQ